ncbi:MAG: transglutaminase-like cysteine peptidase [Sphingomonadales bacterium]
MTPLSGFEARAMPDGGLFGSAEIRNERLDAFVKWNDMVDRHHWQEARRHRREPCRLTAEFDCRRDQWTALLADVAGAEPTDQIRAINTFMNDAEYITDLRNWGDADYWATVREFLQKDGDCEDYAIAKYYSLKALGFDPETMRVVVVQDTNLDAPHAVLAIDFGGETLILDNQITDVVSAASIIHYRPIYSINETAWWLHRL